jgi:hypothetical protein
MNELYYPVKLSERDTMNEWLLLSCQLSGHINDEWIGGISPAASLGGGEDLLVNTYIKEYKDNLEEKAACRLHIKTRVV